MLDRRFPDWIHLVFNFVPGEGLSEGDTSQQDQTKCGTLMDMINLNPLVLPSVAASTAFQGKLCGSGVAALTTIRASLRSITCSVYRSLDYFQPAFALTVELKTALWQPLTAHYDLNTQMILQEPSVTCMVPQLQTSASRVGGLSSESKGLSSGSSSSVTLERGTSSMGAMSTSVCCDMCFWASYKKTSMSTDSCGTTTPSDLFACLSVHQVNLMPCTTCLTGLAEGSVDFQCPGKPYTTLMASCKHHPSTICVVMRIWRCILWTCKDGVGWLHQ
ncbi:uncharacterized protein LOC117551216 isoform X1 [Gymnodraco acuticeps]|uniref:Uncharacterized protein LOC117551216 isoform X1 n=1 Tax=Gymnodraco acuticeps TaxID=8218 RepID=A0A6P8UUU0_GYMAC|nr:uncharacterized protein LOC117551216 isoform X1 [Gymnodraco acuticeps]